MLRFLRKTLTVPDLILAALELDPDMLEAQGVSRGRNACQHPGATSAMASSRGILAVSPLAPFHEDGP